MDGAKTSTTVDSIRLTTVLSSPECDSPAMIRTPEAIAINAMAPASASRGRKERRSWASRVVAKSSSMGSRGKGSLRLALVDMFAFFREPVLRGRQAVSGTSHAAIQRRQKENADQQLEREPADDDNREGALGIGTDVMGHGRWQEAKRSDQHG